MLYSDIRKQAKTGDVFVTDDRGLIPFLIKLFTQQSTNHAAIIDRTDAEGHLLAVIEVGGRQVEGWGMMRASGWLNQRTKSKSKVYYLKRPESCTDLAAMKEYLYKRNIEYDKKGAILSVVARLFNRKLTKSAAKTEKEFCSSFAANVWVKGGAKGIDEDTQPGSLKDHASFMAIVVNDLEK